MKGAKYPIGTIFEYPLNGVTWKKIGIDLYQVLDGGRSVYKPGDRNTYDDYDWEDWNITSSKEDLFDKLYNRLK